MRMFRWLPVVAALFAAGCNTYHYYDITVSAVSPVNANETSTMQFCQILVAGADSHTITWTQNMGCPPSVPFPEIGAFEFATFADSGQLNFTFNGYSMNLDPNMLCTTASTPIQASGTITTPGTITLTSFDQTKCPLHITSTGVGGTTGTTGTGGAAGAG